MPDVPTLNEAGLPGFEIAVWHGLYAPHGTPKVIVDKLAGALQVALKDPLVKQRFADLGTEPVAESRARPEALRTHLKSEIARWAPIISKAGIYADSSKKVPSRAARVPAVRLCRAAAPQRL